MLHPVETITFKEHYTNLYCDCNSMC